MNLTFKVFWITTQQNLGLSQKKKCLNLNGLMGYVLFPKNTEGILKIGENTFSVNTSFFFPVSRKMFLLIQLEDFCISKQT